MSEKTATSFSIGLALPITDLLTVQGPMMVFKLSKDAAHEVVNLLTEGLTRGESNIRNGAVKDGSIEIINSDDLQRGTRQ